MDMRRLRYFLTVAHERSFSRAAAALNMTQPPLSMAVAELEREIGATLLVRTPRGVVPTQAGEFLIAEGTRVVDRLDEVAADIRKIHAGAAGRVGIASVPVTTWVVLPRALQRFLEHAPNVDVSVDDLPPVQVIESVLQERVDVGVIASADATQLENTYSDRAHVRHCGDLELAVGLPPRYRDAPERVSLADLNDETWLVPTRTMRVRSIEDDFDAIWERIGTSTPRVRPVTTLQTAIPLVVAGLGVTLFPLGLHAMAHPELVVRRTVEPLQPLKVVVMWPRRAVQPPMLDALLAEFTRSAD